MRISTGLLTGNLEIDTTEYDEIESTKALADWLKQQLQIAYPEAEITVEWQAASGSMPIPLQTWCDDDDLLQDVEDTIGAINIWDYADEWLIAIDNQDQP